ncbi:hypothetical protein PsAD5_04617 [Pseudovibrio sp. Ad5]|nr:hypothetical protein PsAD5_04617 [Pseudovibrio sp. Ad5]
MNYIVLYVVSILMVIFFYFMCSFGANIQNISKKKEEDNKLYNFLQFFTDKICCHLNIKNTATNKAAVNLAICAAIILFGRFFIANVGPLVSS